jgi:hypothetical protein
MLAKHFLMMLRCYAFLFFALTTMHPPCPVPAQRDHTIVRPLFRYPPESSRPIALGLASSE